MPIYRNFQLPTAQATPQIVNDVNDAYTSLASQYQQRYDAAQQAENELISMMGNVDSTIRPADRELVHEELGNTKKVLDQLSQREGKGFLLPKIQQEAARFANTVKPFQQALATERKAIEDLSKLNLTPQQKQQRANYIHQRSNVKRGDQGYYFDYQPQSFSENVDVTEEVNKYLKQVRPDQQSFGGSQVLRSNAEGFIVNPVTGESQFVGSPNSLVKVTGRGSTERLNRQELANIGRRVAANNPDIQRFLNEEFMVRRAAPEYQDMTDNEIKEAIYREKIENPVNIGADIFDVDNRSSTSDFGIIAGGQQQQQPDSRGYNFRSFSKNTSPKIASEISGLDTSELKGDKFKQTSEPEIDEIKESATGSIAVFESITPNKSTPKLSTEKREQYENFLSSEMARNLGYTGDPNDIYSQEAINAIDKYNNLIDNQRFSIGYQTYDRLGEEGRSKREDKTKDVNTILPDLTVWSEEKGRLLTFEEKKELLGNENIAIGENSPENMITTITDNDAFATSYSVDSFGKDGRLKDRLIVSGQSSEQDSSKGKRNRVVNKIYTTLNSTPGLWVEFKNAFGNQSVNVRSIMDAQTGEITGYEIQGIDGKFENVPQTLQYIKNARR